jgi:hypothetical protein
MLNGQLVEVRRIVGSDTDLADIPCFDAEGEIDIPQHWISHDHA